jgi:hypothetical protein
MEIIRHAETCTVRVVGSSNTIEAVVDNFIFESALDVVLNKSVKVKMKWNGKCFEGRAAGMNIESNGPKITKTKTSIRG